SGSVALGGVLAVIRMLSPMGGTRALLLCPLIFVSDHMISTLQIGNLQAMVIALAMVAMVLLVRGRYLAGGLLLAYVTLSKMFPVLLLVYLLVKRQWRALAWTIGACAVLVAISVLDTGWTPYHAFLKQFPRLLGGEAFPAFRNPVSIAKNYSVPGMVFKLHLFGLPGTSFQVMKIVGSIYMLIDLAATVAFARQTRNRDEQPIVWLAILILASLRSPFLPSYAILPALWLLTLVAAGAELGAKRLWLVLVAWVMLNASVPMLNPDPRLTSAAVLISQAAIVVLVVLAFRHRREPRGREPLDATAVGTWNPALHRQASISDHIVGNLALGTRSAALPGRQEELDKVGMSPSTAAVAGAIAVSQTVHPSLMARSVHRANRLHR
ncbi:MAG TPA: glycosyltransferase family 87 protein, partial [Acidobacteriaceae bacterium]